MTRTVVSDAHEHFYVKEIAPDTGKFVVTVGGWKLPKENPEDTQLYSYIEEDDWIRVPYPPGAAWWLYTFSTQTYTPRDFPEDWNGLLADPSGE